MSSCKQQIELWPRLEVVLTQSMKTIGSACRPENRQSVLATLRKLKMARSAHAYVRGNTLQFYEWLESSPGNCFLRELRSASAGIDREARRIVEALAVQRCRSSKLYIADQRERGHIVVCGRSPHELPGSLQNSQTQFLCGEDGRGLKALSHAL